MQSSTLDSNHHTGSFQWRARGRAAAIHLAASAAVAALAGLLVFGIWYPYPYREISGGRELFLLVVGVDIVMGPLITFTIFNRAKPATELRRDLAIVVVLQLAALAYGLWTVQLARPVHLVFEYDRFRVVHQVDIPQDQVAKAPAGIDVAPWGGPTVIALRPFESAQESSDMTMQALGGVTLSARPELWRPYPTQTGQVLLAAKPVASLIKRFPSRAAEVEAAVGKTGRTAEQVVYLPIVARKAVAWTVLLDAKSAEILGYPPLDPY